MWDRWRESTSTPFSDPNKQESKYSTSRRISQTTETTSNGRESNHICIEWVERASWWDLCSFQSRYWRTFEGLCLREEKGTITYQGDDNIRRIYIKAVNEQIESQIVCQIRAAKVCFKHLHGVAQHLCICYRNTPLQKWQDKLHKLTSHQSGFFMIDRSICHERLLMLVCHKNSVPVILKAQPTSKPYYVPTHAMLLRLNVHFWCFHQTSLMKASYQKPSSIWLSYHNIQLTLQISHKTIGQTSTSIHFPGLHKICVRLDRGHHMMTLTRQEVLCMPVRINLSAGMQMVSDRPIL